MDEDFIIKRNKYFQYKNIKAIFNSLLYNSCDLFISKLRNYICIDFIILYIRI